MPTECKPDNNHEIRYVQPTNQVQRGLKSEDIAIVMWEASQINISTWVLFGSFFLHQYNIVWIESECVIQCSSTDCMMQGKRFIVSIESNDGFLHTNWHKVGMTGTHTEEARLEVETQGQPCNNWMKSNVADAKARRLSTSWPETKTEEHGPQRWQALNLSTVALARCNFFLREW
jgi:hypothetical protein